jgi:hypothetical protein
MMAETDGRTRFEEAKSRVNAIMSDATEGSVFTLITVSDSTTVVFEKTKDAKRASMLLGELSPKDTNAPLTEAISRAQRYFNENSGIRTYLFTDKSYTETKNIQVVDLSRGEENYAVDSMRAELSGSRLTVYATVISYESDTTLDLTVVIDGRSDLTFKEQREVKAGKPTEVTFTYSVSDFDKIELSVDNSDSLDKDNRYVLLDADFVNSYKTLIVSDTPFFIESVLSAGSSADMTVVSRDEYSEETYGRGYGLYIFHNFSPKAMPSDGTVWFINPTDNVQNSGFSHQGEITVDTEGGGELSLTSSSNTVAKRLTAGVGGKGIFVEKYVKLGLYSNFTTLMSYKGAPMIFTGTNSFGNREVVFAFDLHSSNLPLLADYVFLVNNLLDFSFPSVIEQTEYRVEDTVLVNSVANCESIRVEAPSGEATYLDLGSSVASFTPKEAGLYRIILTVEGTEREYSIFAALGESERDPTVSEDSISLAGVASDAGLDGIFDTIMIVFVLIVLTYIADWGVYCYDKYQLR